MSTRGHETRRAFLERLGGVAIGGAAACVAAAEQGSVASAEPAVQGKVIRRGAPDYEAVRTRAVWQAIKPARYPSLTVQARTESDIVETLRYARAQGLPVGILGSGHNYVGTGLREGGVLLDVSALRALDIDAQARIARIEPGVRALELCARLGEHGLAFPIAHNPTVGMGGFLLGGGMGWNAESWGGLACFNVRAVEVVTAAGERLTLDKDSHPDLFWAARGAGPAFCAVATRFHLDVFPRPQAIVSATFVYPIARAPEVIAWLETYRERQPTNLELVLLFAHDTRSGVGGRDSQQCIVSAVCFAGDDVEAHRVLDALGAGAPARDLLHAERFQPTTLEGLLAADLASLPIRHCVETFWINGAAEPLHALARHFRDAPSAHTLVYANYRADPRLRGDGAYSVMAPLFIFSAAAWIEAQDDAGNQRWSDDLVTTLGPYTAGAYINEVEFTRHPARARRCFSHASWERLAAVNSRYDPTGMFTPPFLQRPPAG